MFALALMNRLTLSGQVAIPAPVVADDGPWIGWLPQSFIPVRPWRYNATTPAVTAEPRDVLSLMFVGLLGSLFADLT